MSSSYLFIGDSITDAGRFDDSDRHLGAGYVRRLDELLAAEGLGLSIVNRGIGGNRAVDLRARWQADVLAEEPELVSVHVGINDTWRRYDSGDPTSATQFEEHYRAFLGSVDREVTRTVVLIEPFLVPVTEEQAEWRADLEEKIDVVRRLAVEFGAILVPADGRLADLALEHGAPAVADDGVHPTALGHACLAELWLTTVREAQGAA